MSKRYLVVMNFSKLFVIFDPGNAAQYALERAVQVAQYNRTSLHVFACVHESTDDLRKIEECKAAYRKQIETAVAPLRENCAEVTVQVEWGSDWAGAAVQAASQVEADAVIKAFRPQPHRDRLGRSADWTLIRECKCPVLLVKADKRWESPRVLAAVDIRAQRDSYRQLNHHIIEFGRYVLDFEPAEVHYVNAFQGINNRPDRNDLVENCGVPSDRVLIRMGQPDDVIIQAAGDLEASLVVVGNSCRSGLAAVVNGNTVEKVLDRIACDVMSMP